MGNPEAASAEPQIIGEKSSIGVLLKLAQLYRIISKADDQEIAILLAYAQNLMAARPVVEAETKPYDKPTPDERVQIANLSAWAGQSTIKKEG